MPCPYPSDNISKPYVGQFGLPIANSLPTIIRSFKSAVTKEVNIARDAKGTPVWQKGYYEHVIRNESSWTRLRDYIQTNPISWQLDQLHPDNPSKW